MGLLSSKHRKRKIAITLVSLFLALVTAVGAVCLYVGDYYRTDKKAVEVFSYGSPVTEREIKGGLAFLPEDPQAGFIFYPGGKVEYTAYKPLMTALAEKGVLCVLLKMPLNLAVLDVNAAEGVQEMNGQNYYYYFVIDAVRRAGDAVPLEQLRATIRRVLFNQRQQQVIRDHEQALYEQSMATGGILLYESGEDEDPQTNTENE